MSHQISLANRYTSALSLEALNSPLRQNRANSQSTKSIVVSRYKYAYKRNLSIILLRRPAFYESLLERLLKVSFSIFLHSRVRPNNAPLELSNWQTSVQTTTGRPSTSTLPGHLYEIYNFFKVYHESRSLVTYVLCVAVREAGHRRRSSGASETSGITTQKSWTPRILM